MLYTVTALNCPPTLEDAIVLAVQAHHGQVYPTPGGEPFIRHPLRVMLQVEADIERIVAVLHDLVEDTAYTLDDVRRLGYPDEAIEALDRFTRREEEAYEECIGRSESHPIARRIKMMPVAGQEPRPRPVVGHG
jgi:(p)ppGpp synthase/HD superfamily hydrolase